MSGMHTKNERIDNFDDEFLEASIEDSLGSHDIKAKSVDKK